MQTITLRIVTGMLPLVTLVALVGCAASDAHEASEIAAQRAKLVLKEEPSDAVFVSDAKESLVDGAPLVLVGRISAGRHDPWDEGRATFLLSDPMASFDEDDSHHNAPGHDPDKCPFCSRKKADKVLTIVQFNGADGRVIPIDARRLLGLKNEQLVVVRGTATVDPQGNVLLLADGVYVRE